MVFRTKDAQIVDRQYKTIMIKKDTRKCINLIESIEKDNIDLSTYLKIMIVSAYNDGERVGLLNTQKVLAEYEAFITSLEKLYQGNKIPK